MTEARTLEVAADDAGERLDVYLARALPHLSRNQIQALIREGDIRVTGRLARPSHKLATGERIAVREPEAPSPSDAAAPAPELPLSILHADPDLIVVDKPAGQVVHPALGHRGDTLVNALLARYPDLRDIGDGPRPGIVHRLDRDTSGVMVVGRTADAAAHLRRQFKARTVEKVYLALVSGRLSPPEAVIDAPIGRDPDHRQRMAAVPGGRPAQTTYRVLAESPTHSWVEARPRTGRTHQIRVHLAAIGHPVLGDTVYGRKDRAIGRTALHAWRLAFDHPGTGRRVRFEAPLPEDLRAALGARGILWRPQEAR